MIGENLSSDIYSAIHSNVALFPHYKGHMGFFVFNSESNNPWTQRSWDQQDAFVNNWLSKPAPKSSSFNLKANENVSLLKCQICSATKNLSMICLYCVFLKYTHWILILGYFMFKGINWELTHFAKRIIESLNHWGRIKECHQSVHVSMICNPRWDLPCHGCSNHGHKDGISVPSAMWLLTIFLPHLYF